RLGAHRQFYGALAQISAIAQAADHTGRRFIAFAGITRAYPMTARAKEGDGVPLPSLQGAVSASGNVLCGRDREAVVTEPGWIKPHESHQPTPGAVIDGLVGHRLVGREHRLRAA